jgi:hypothetical protein
MLATPWTFRGHFVVTYVFLDLRFFDNFLFLLYLFFKNKEETMLSLASLRDIVCEEDPLKTNRALSQLLEDTDSATDIGIEEVSNICVLFFIVYHLCIF